MLNEENMELVLMFISLFSLIQADINCGKGKYLDTITRTCAYCSDICVLAQRKRTSEDCAEFCPDYGYEFEHEQDETETVTASIGKLYPSTSAPGGSDAGDLTAIIGITVGALVVIVIAVIIGVLIYRKKCCWQRDDSIISCGAHLKARIKKCHETDEEKGENMPLEQLANDEQKETKKKKHQLCHPHDDGSNNKLIPSCSRNEIDT